LKRSALLFITIGLAGLSILTLAIRKGGPPPHSIIIIDIDTLRADHLGHYGYRRDTSPSFDALAAESTSFSWAFAQSPWTVPSQASILTGMYPTRHGFVSAETAISDSVVTLAESLREADFKTAAFVDGGYMAEGFGFERGFEIYNDEAGGLAAIGPRVDQWLDANANGDESFLLLIHSYDVHTPYDSTPEPFRSMYVDENALPSEQFRNTFGLELLRVWEGRFADDPQQMGDAEINYIEALYDGGIRYMDTWLGEFIADLKDRGLYDKTLLVFLSDHGEEFLDHKGVMHDKIYVPVTRIPLLLKLPDQHEGISIDAVVESIDVLPTVLDVVGLDAPPDIDGTSLLPIVHGRARASEQIAISESLFYGRRIGVATHSYHLLTSLIGDRTQLFEYRVDPLEQRDISAENPEISTRLTNYAKAWNAMVKKGAYEQKDAQEIKQSTIDRLKALGYLGN
jgi:arylsulfatase A-like enzyme